MKVLRGDMSVGEMSGGFDREAYVRVGKRLDPPGVSSVGVVVSTYND